jgi:DNA-binding LacI/PurR family transcriptional regulator
LRTSARTIIAKATGIENWKEMIPEEAVRRMYINPITEMTVLVNNAHCAQDFFKQALAREDITAWVCANDDLAIAAWQFLRKHDRCISLLGFDNSPLAQIRGIASYDFYPDMLGHMAVQCLREPRRMLRAWGAEIPVRGALIERASLSRAKSRSQQRQ